MRENRFCNTRIQSFQPVHLVNGDYSLVLITVMYASMVGFVMNCQENVYVLQDLLDTIASEVRSDPTSSKK